MISGADPEYPGMSTAPTVAPRRPRENMSEPGDPSPSGAAVRVEDIERAIVLAREVAAATASGGAANLRMDHLRALFANGDGRADPERMQAALAAAGLTVDPPLYEEPDSVSLRVERRRAALAPKGGAAKRAAAPRAGASGDDPPPRPAGVAAYQAAAGGARRARARAAERAESPATGGVSLDDAQRIVAADQAAQNTPQAIAALMPALIVPVLAASFLGPLFGVAFAGLALLASALLSRPGALADGKLGPIRMPASLARSFLLLTAGVAIGALATSAALVAAGGGDTKPADPNAPIEQKQQKPAPTTTAPKTTPPAPPAAEQQKKDAAAERRAQRRAAARRRAARERRARAREAAPPSGGPEAPATTTP
jgi:hypothetical protein